MNIGAPHLRPVPPPIAGRVPPHDLDAEAAVLSAVLVAKGLDIVADRLTAEDFYADANAKIFEAAKSLWAVGRPVDLVTVAGVLRDGETLARVGGTAYLAQLADATPAVEHLEAHALRVRDKARLRTMIATCQRVAAEGYGDVGDLGEWLDTAEQSVCDVAREAESTAMHSARDILGETFRRIYLVAQSGNKIIGTPTGFDYLDSKMGGLHAGALTVLAARPGMGKSSLALNIAVNVALSGNGVGFFSLEMSDEELSLRMIGGHSGVNVKRLLRGEVRDSEWPALTKSAEALGPIPIWFDESGRTKPIELRAKTRRLVGSCQRANVPLKLIVVDYIQLMDATGMVAKNSTRDREVSAITSSLKALAKEAKVHVLALSQMNRQAELRKGDERRPRLADLRDSGSIEQDADNVMFVFREDYYEKDTDKKGTAELIIAKQRSGPTCTVPLRWFAECCRFESAPYSADHEAAE